LMCTSTSCAGFMQFCSFKEQRTLRRFAVLPSGFAQLDSGCAFLKDLYTPTFNCMASMIRLSSDSHPNSLMIPFNEFLKS